MSPRIVPPAEARVILGRGIRYVGPELRDLAHTVAVLGEQREKVLALHSHGHWCWDESWNPRCYLEEPCPTARALGVTE